MTKLNIDLGVDYKDNMPSLKDIKDEMHYPSFRIESDTVLDLPYEGTMTVRYCKRESSHRVDTDGDEHYSCQITVKEIKSVEAAKGSDNPTKSYAKESEDALDMLAKKLTAKLDEERLDGEESESY